MIENQDVTGEDEKHFGQLQIVLTGCPNLRLEKSDRFVAEKTNGASSEPWQLRTCNESVPRHQFAELIERIGRRAEPFLDSISQNTDFAPVALNDHSRIESDE